jgi:hypothetical protein
MVANIPAVVTPVFTTRLDAASVYQELQVDCMHVKPCPQLHCCGNAPLARNQTPTCPAP